MTNSFQFGRRKSGAEIAKSIKPLVFYNNISLLRFWKRKDSISSLLWPRSRLKKSECWLLSGLINKEQHVNCLFTDERFEFLVPANVNKPDWRGELPILQSGRAPKSGAESAKSTEPFVFNNKISFLRHCK